MNTDRIREIQKETAYPDSRSVEQALSQVWNECAQESNWVNVDDELPTEGVTVLVYTNFGDTYTCRRPVIERKNDRELHMEGVTHEMITHWMPLPKSPKVK